MVEGWKFENIKKIEVFRNQIKKPVLCDDYDGFIAIATTSKNLKIKKNIRILNLDNINEIADFILSYFKIKLCTNLMK